MRTNNEERFGLWELAVLALLRESPMHPYQMQKMLRERHKDDLLTLKRGSLYHAIHRLERAALIEVAHIAREGKRPERTTYRITALGRKELVRWLQQIIAVPKRESSDLMAALSFLPFLTVKDAVGRLEERSGRLESEIAGRGAEMKRASAWVGRIHLIESEYLCAMLQAELEWVRALAGELRSGKLTWDLQAMLKEAPVVRARAEAARATSGKARAGTGKKETSS